MGLFTDKTRWQHFAWAISIGAVLTIHDGVRHRCTMEQLDSGSQNQEERRTIQRLQYSVAGRV